MKNKTPLPLMEQLIMILVFALSAALCLQDFALADHLSRQQKSREKAVVIAQNIAETLKAFSGDYASAFEQTGGVWDGSDWNIYYDESGRPLPSVEDSVFLTQVTPLESGNPLLGSAHIHVHYDQEILFEITISWQEVNTDAIP